MNKGKKIVLLIGILACAVLIWHLFVKSYDYQIRFSTRTAPGTVFYHVNNWTKTREKEGQIEILNVDKDPFVRIRQNLKIGDSLIHLDWDIRSANDSTTDIMVRVKDMEHSVATRIKNFYTDPPLKELFLSKISNFNTSLGAHLKEHKIKIVGESDIPEGFYAYLNIKSSLPEKAYTMIAGNAEIAGWLNDNDIKILSEPILEVTSWDIPKDEIQFNFMFPITETDSLPDHKKIKFKKYGGGKGIKAVFNGNYMISDRAWFALYEYAKQNNIDIDETPVEFFFNNPMSGGNELEWKAEIYLPIKDSND
ncbi:MAG: GyrI-like domain-containing protein [Saonia sp.]